ncbi:sugar transferase [Aquamicrobium ahrensii]|uniref:Exopolysaccharide production protein ExoY n=1 Tax=Aquamicrobium ahrensii TaxID=469551 RepID=A0ABV2KGZ9_9HYPH
MSIRERYYAGSSALPGRGRSFLDRGRVSTSGFQRRRSGEVQDAAVSIPAAASSGFVHVWPHPLGGRAKRALDGAVAVTALVLALPLMLVVALLIKLTSKGPAVFSHQRIGFNGRTFRCYKFRTMVADAEERLQAHLASDPHAAEEWSKARKLKHDPRLTVLGSLLRKSSLDELPQLFNILRGEMSCVGPRPIVAEELRRYGPVAKDYLRTRPGLTGLWQVTGRDSVDYAGRVMLDAQYVRNWSMRTDLLILIRTVGAVTKFDRAS